MRQKAREAVNGDRRTLKGCGEMLNRTGNTFPSLSKGEMLNRTGNC